MIWRMCYSDVFRCVVCGIWQRDESAATNGLELKTRSVRHADDDRPQRSRRNQYATPVMHGVSGCTCDST